MLLVYQHVQNVRDRTDLHRSAINEDSIKLFKGPIGMSRTIEDDSGNATANSIWTICNQNLLDGADGVIEIIL